MYVKLESLNVFYKINVLYLIFLFVIFISIVGIFFFTGNSSSSSFPSNSCGSSGSSGNPKKDSFWRKYWKEIVGSVVLVGVSISLVVFYCYYKQTSNIDSDDLNTLYTIVHSNNYYLTTDNQFVNFLAIVLDHPGEGQYAPFSVYWEHILRETVSQEEYEAAIALLDVNALTSRDRLVLTSEDFDEVVSLVQIARDELMSFVKSR